jgi:transposase, IS30 family
MNQFKQLTREERYIIKSLLKEGFSVRSIGDNLGRHFSTIYREIERNRGLKGYRPNQAHNLAIARNSESHRYCKFTTETQALVEQFICIEYSPEQVSNYLHQEYCIAISTERIYQHIWEDKKAGGELYRHLRQSSRQRRKRSRTYDSRGQIPNRISIDERPAIVEERVRVGDWEIDTIIGKNHQGVCVTVVDRVSKFTLIKNLESKHAELVADAVIDLLMPYKDKVHTITGDNGKEFAQHERIATQLDTDFYFAHPYSSWERGTNENTNGLIRQYFNKGMDFSFIDERDTAFVMNRLNNRPRKGLNYISPITAFSMTNFFPPCREERTHTSKNNYITDTKHKTVALAI